MRRASFGLIPILAVVALFFLPAMSFAQNSSRNRFVISAKAGGVNAVTGGATVRTQGQSEWEQLTVTEDLQTGDLVKTGFDGRVEMLLNPGSYLRVGENSEFELTNNSLDNLEIKLLRGTAIVEATGADDSQLQINISTPHTKLAIVRRGLYRLNVIPGDNTELIVRKGRVMLDRSQTKINGGNKVVFSNESFFVAKMDKAEKKRADAIDMWSKDRAETVAQANRKIRGREMSMAMAGLRDGWFSNMSASSGGFWFFNQRFGCYTFVPYFMGWGSPYGSAYSNAFFRGYYRNGGVFGNIWDVNGYPTYRTGNRSAGNGGSPAPAGNSASRPVQMPTSSGESAPRPAALEGRVRRHQDP